MQDDDFNLATRHDDPSPHAIATTTRQAFAARQSRRLKPPVLTELAPKHRLLAEYMVNGCPHDRLCDFLKRKERTYDEAQSAWIEREVTVKAGQPLTLLESAMVLGIRARQARDLAKQPLWHKHYSGLLQSFREGHKAEALRTVVDIMRDPGQGKAADRKVRLTAAAMIDPDLGPQQSQTDVNVQVGVAVQTPGYVLDLRPDPEREPPQTIKPAPAVIDIEPNRG